MLALKYKHQKAEESRVMTTETQNVPEPSTHEKNSGESDKPIETPTDNTCAISITSRRVKGRTLEKATIRTHF